MDILTLLAAFLTGLLASMGVGGGMLLIIWLTAVVGTNQLEAQGINLIFFLPIALLSVIIHRKNKLIDLRALKYSLATGLIGTVGGVLAAKAIEGNWLKLMFSVFILIVGVKELWAGIKSSN